MTDHNESPEPRLRSDVPALAWLRRAMRGTISRNQRFRTYFWVLRTPVLSELYIAGRGRLRHRRLSPATRLVVEAFPSSANTFAVDALLLANPELTRDEISSHSHGPRVVQRAVRQRVPCIVVARDPRDAVASMVQRFPGIHLDSAFDYHRTFYGRLLPLRDQIVVAPFDIVVSDLDSVIARCNETYGTSFSTLSSIGVSHGNVLQRIEERQRNRFGGKLNETRIARPSAVRMKAADFLRDLTPRQTRAMNRAIETYEAFVRDVPSARGH